MTPDQPFSLALGGGGGRGWAHLGVARALDEAGLRPALIVGTSMGAIVGAGLAAGMRPEQIERMAKSSGSVYRVVGKRARFALFDPQPRPGTHRCRLGNPRIEDLPGRLAVTAYDLVSGTPTAITSGPLVEALRRSIAVPLFFPPRPTRTACGATRDRGSRSRSPSPAASRPIRSSASGSTFPSRPSWPRRPWRALLRGAARLTAGEQQRLTARRYFSLLTQRWADPVVAEPPDLLIRPRLGLSSGLRFSQVGPGFGHRLSRRLRRAGGRRLVAASASGGGRAHRRLCPPEPSWRPTHRACCWFMPIPMTRRSAPAA